MSFSSPKTWTDSEKARLVVTMVERRSYLVSVGQQVSKLNRSSPPTLSNGTNPSSSQMSRSTRW